MKLKIKMKCSNNSKYNSHLNHINQEIDLGINKDKTTNLSLHHHETNC